LANRNNDAAGSHRKTGYEKNMVRSISPANIYAFSGTNDLTTRFTAVPELVPVKNHNSANKRMEQG
jgi:hypothetical protein